MNRVSIEVQRAKALLATMDERGVKRPFSDEEIDEMAATDEPDILKFANLERINRYLRDLLTALSPLY